MTSDQRDQRPDGISDDAERSGPSVQEQADSVLSGRATTVDTGVSQAEGYAEADQGSEETDQPAKKASKPARSKSGNNSK